MSAILLAEDDESVRAFVTRALTHRGHEVTAVSDGDAAIEALKAQTYDLMLTDIVMPGLDGLALAETAARINPRMTVLMMTGFADARERADGLRTPGPGRRRHHQALQPAADLQRRRRRPQRRTGGHRPA